MAVDSGIEEKMLPQIGAGHFIDYTQENFTSSGQKYDVILHMVAQISYTQCVNSLTPTGRYLMGNPRLSEMLRSVFTTRFTDRRASFAFAGETEEELLALKEMIEQGKIKSAVDKIYPMEQAADAHRRVKWNNGWG